MSTDTPEVNIIIKSDSCKWRMQSVTWQTNKSECVAAVNLGLLTGAAVIALLTPYLDKFNTITSDNGKEFAAHEAIARAVGADFYFAPLCQLRARRE